MNSLIVKCIYAQYRFKGSSIVHERFFRNHSDMNRFLYKNDDEVILLEIHVMYVDEKKDIQKESSAGEQSWVHLSLFDC